MNIKQSILLSIFCLATVLSIAQVPSPAAKETRSTLILNGTAHLGNGQVIPNAIIGIIDGKLSVVGDASTIRVEREAYQEIIDANGKEIYPGFIAPNSQLGLREIDAVRSTVDDRETGSFNPSVRSIIAYNTDSRVTPTVRSNGILIAQIVPQGGRVSGTSSIVTLDAWNWEDAAYKTDDGLYLSWPLRFPFRGFRFSDQAPQYPEQVAELQHTFQEAKAYINGNPTTINLKFEAMRGLFDGTQRLYIRTNDAQSIMDAVSFSETFGMNPVIVGGRDAWMITDFLKQHNTPIMLSGTHNLPPSQDDDIDLPYKLPKLLHDAGVEFCISLNGGWGQRVLMFHAGQAVAYGLPYEAAIQALTLNTAKILNIDNQVGSLEVGKDATLIISTGDALDMRTNQIEHAFIQGRAINLDDKQKALYRKFKEKYDNQ